MVQRDARKVLVRKHGLFRRPRYKWEHNLEMDLKEIRCEDVD
jgi:hypothetical protein